MSEVKKMTQRTVQMVNDDISIVSTDGSYSETTETNKNSLISKLNGMSVQELKDIAALCCIKSISKLGKRQNIIDAIVQIVWENLMKMTQTNLKKICKFYGYSSMSKLKNKTELVHAIIMSYLEGIPDPSSKEYEYLSFDAYIDIVMIDEKLNQEKINDELNKQNFEEIKKRQEADDRIIQEEVYQKQQEESRRQKEAEELQRLIKEMEELKNKMKEPKRKAFDKNIRKTIWNAYIGSDIIKHKCLCCKLAHITNTEFEVGHIQAFANGGTDEITNLRPICSACNKSMGTKNMREYVIEHGLFF